MFWVCYNNFMEKELKKFIKQNYIKPKKDRKIFLKFLHGHKTNKQKSKEFKISQCCCNGNVDFGRILQETFVQYLFRIIDEKGLKDSEVYKKANIDRKLFSKIRSNINYTPSKNTLLALVIGLELNLDEAKIFLEKAGYALSKSILTDVIVEYYIINKEYNIFKINQTIFDYKLQPLGSI